ncbi:MAG: hypothetical protein HFJ38_02760, partial [Bacilli bacterium]|nr:hypothetical protein [Bacilli bacterium]
MNNKINSIFNNLVQYFKKVKNEHLVRAYIKENPLFITYVLINVLNSTLLRFFTITSIENYLS